MRKPHVHQPVVGLAELGTSARLRAADDTNTFKQIAALQASDGTVVKLEPALGEAVSQFLAALTASSNPEDVLEQFHSAAKASHLSRVRQEARDRVEDALRRVQDARTPPVDQQTLDYLREHAGLSDTSVLDDWSPERARAIQQEAAAATRLQLEADTMSREEAARLLDVHPSSVSRSITQRKLVAVTRDGRPRLPRWQFVNNEPVPGLREIAPVLDHLGMEPVSVATIMLRPQEFLNGLAPVDYLRSGGNPAEVVAYLDGLARA